MVQIVSVARRSFVVVLALVVLSTVVFVVPATAARSGTVSTNLNGKEQVPPVSTKGRGTAEFKLKPNEGMNPEIGTICFKIKLRDLSSPPTEGHIHQGLPGTDGPRRVQLDPLTEGESEGCVPAERNLIEVISKHPDRFYVAIHTVEFPEGELRGQLERGPLHKK